MNTQEAMDLLRSKGGQAVAPIARIPAAYNEQIDNARGLMRAGMDQSRPWYDRYADTALGGLAYFGAPLAAPWQAVFEEPVSENLQTAGMSQQNADLAAAVASMALPFGYAKWGQASNRVAPFMTDLWQNYARTGTFTEAPRAATIPLRGSIGGNALDPELGELGAIMVNGRPEIGPQPVGKSGKPIDYKAPWSKTKIPYERALELDAGLKVDDTALSDLYHSPRTVKPEDLEGGVVFALSGDRAGVTRIIEVDGKKLTVPVDTDGGYFFPSQKDESGWASFRSVLASIRNKMKPYTDEGFPVFGMYDAMGGTATDFANKTRNVLKATGHSFQDISVKDAKEFDKWFRSNPKVKTELKKALDDYPGIRSSELDAWFDKSGKRRSTFFGFIDMAMWNKRDAFPDMAAMRHAVAAPNLRYMPSDFKAGGHGIFRFNPEGIIVPSSSMGRMHTTYQDTMYKDLDFIPGGLEIAVPREVLYPDWYRTRASQKKNIGDLSFRTTYPRQLATPEWVDTVSGYIENTKRGLPWPMKGQR